MAQANILIVGSYNVGKKRVVSAYTGIAPSTLMTEDDYYYVQLKGTKGNITIQGIPEQFGRFPVYRERTKTVADSQAFIILGPMNDKVATVMTYIKDYHNTIKEDSKLGSPPILLLLTYTTPTPPAVPSEVAKWAKGAKATIEFINPDSLKQPEELAKLNKYINNLASAVKPAVLLPAPTAPTPAPTLLTKSASPPSSSPSRLVRLISSLFNKNDAGTTAA